MSPLFFILSLSQCLYLLHGLNHSACYNSEFIIDSPLCGSTGYLAPKKFLFGQISPSSSCRAELSGQRDYHIVRRCCKFHNGDTILKEVCIPGQKKLLSSPLYQMARHCSRGNRCDSEKRLSSTELLTGDYVSLEFDCVHAKDEIRLSSDEVLYGKNVYLISDKKDGSVRDAKCAVYNSNPHSSIVIALVDNLVLSGTCTVSFASSVSATTNINCAKTEIVNGCNNVLYTTTRSRVDINLTMDFLANNSDRQFLWMVASVSDGGNLTVACGKKIPPDGNNYTSDSSTQSTNSLPATQTSSHNDMTSFYSKTPSNYPRTKWKTHIWASLTGFMTTAASGLNGSNSSKGFELSTRMHLISDTSSGLRYTTSSSPLFTTLGRKQASSTASLPSTERSSSRTPTYLPSPTMTGTLSPSVTHSTTGGIHTSETTSISTRPSQMSSSFLFKTPSSTNVTTFRPLKTTKPTSHPAKVSASEGTSPSTSTNATRESSFSPPAARTLPSSSTLMMPTFPSSNATSPQTYKTSSHQSSGPMLANSTTASLGSHTSTETTYNSRISRSFTVPITSTATWSRTSKLTHESRQSTQSPLSKTNSMSDSSSGFQFTTPSSPSLTTLGRILASSTTASLQSTKMSSSRTPTSLPSPTMTGTLSPSVTHSTTGGIHTSETTSISTRPSQMSSSSLFKASSSTNVTTFRPLKTTKTTSHPAKVSASEGTTSPSTSTSKKWKSSFSPPATRRLPSSSTTMKLWSPTSNATSPQTNRTSSHQPPGLMLANSTTSSLGSRASTETTYNSRKSRSSTVPITSTATWSRTSNSTHGSGGSTQIPLSKTDSMSDSSSGLQFTTPSSPSLTTLGRILASSTTASLQSTKRSSSRTPTSLPSPTMTGTLSPSVTHSTTGGIHTSETTSISTRPGQMSSSSLFKASLSTNVTTFRPLKTTKPTSHPAKVSASEGTTSPSTSTSKKWKSSFSPPAARRLPSSSTTMMPWPPTSNATSPQTNRTSSHQPPGLMLANSTTSSLGSRASTETTYNSRKSRSSTVPITSTATWSRTSSSTHGSGGSTQIPWSKTDSMSDSSSGLQFTTPSSPSPTTLGRILASSTTASFQSTKTWSSLPRTNPSSPSMIGTSSPAGSSSLSTRSATLSTAKQSSVTPGRSVNMTATYLPTVSRQPPVENATWHEGKTDNNDDKIGFILEVITSLTGAALLILMVITTAMCLCFKKRMNELKRNSRHSKKLSETKASTLELKRRSVVSLESGYCSNSISS